MTRTRALAAFAGVAALIIPGASPASAAFWSHEDAVGDVVSHTVTVDDDDVVEVRPGNTDTDVTRVSLDHRIRRLVLRTTLRDITAGSGFAMYDLRTDDRRYYAFQRLGRDRSFPAFHLARWHDDRRVRCAGVERRVDRTVGRATLHIPRRCLGRPEWVRVGTGVAKFEETDTSFTFFADDAMRDAEVVDKLGLSPRLGSD